MTGAQRVAKRRAALRAQGLHARTFWLPDPNTEEFKEQAKRDVEAINAMRSRDEDIAFIQSIQYWPEDEYDWGADGPP